MSGRCAISSALRLAALVVGGLATGTTSAEPPQATAPLVEPYVPGLGDFMTGYVQPHHIKLWFAGRATNWKLAAYEADELVETFDDVTTYRASWNEVPVAQLVESVLRPALQEVIAAIADRSAPRFKVAYGRRTAACNACHRAVDHDFLVIKAPIANPFPDQDFRRH